MQFTERIPTTHAGSLPRPAEIVELLYARNAGQPVEDDAVEALMSEGVEAIVARQRELGIDIVSDGELNKISFNRYILERFAGFEQSPASAEMVFEDLEEFPGVAQHITGLSKNFENLKSIGGFACVGPIKVIDGDAVHGDIARLRSALGDSPPESAFLTAPTPGQVTFNFANAYFGTHEEYLAEAAQAMRWEYKAIVDAGFNLQLDSPDCAMAGHMHSPKNPNVGDVHAHNVLAVEALNEAIRGLPPERIRLHICWGNYGGPHNHDVGLDEILPMMLKANVGTFSFEAANPRHAHEWEVFERIELPEGTAIMPGVIDVTTNRIEHPRLVAQRLIRFAGLVGKENVIAATDCGFGTIAGQAFVHPGVAWAKLESLVQGARIASTQLWG